MTEVSFPKPRVLIVEDEILIAEELSLRLEHFGFEVIATADTADEAVDIAIRDTPDLVLMDIRLRGAKDGIQAAQEIRAHKNIPVIYLTAYSDRITLDRALPTEPEGYVLKPFHERELQIAIELAMYRHSVQQSSTFKYRN